MPNASPVRASRGRSSSRRRFRAVPATLVCATCLLPAVAASAPTRAEVEARMGMPSDGNRVRGQKDTVGFVVTAAQAEAVISRAAEAEGDVIRERDRRLGLSPSVGYVGGVCPHDDHLYAARAYVHLTQKITAPRVLLVGVFHKARLWNLEGRLVFDSFEAWHGPWKPVPVDPLRRELLDALAPDDRVVSNAMHEMEHSLEAIVPFLQYRNRDVTIVPILVPYVTWDRLRQLSDALSSALAAAMRRHGWELGRDVAVVVSSDAVHYGEDFDHAPFGTDAHAYLRAVARDHRLVHEHLEGPLREDRLHSLLDRLVDSGDVHRYRIPWCGRFSVPFGLEVLRKTSLALGEPPPVGHLLRYATSLSEPEPDLLPGVRGGLGYTAPSNFHHWVGYAAVGYVSARPASHRAGR